LAEGTPWELLAIPLATPQEKGALAGKIVVRAERDAKPPSLERRVQP
jgi:hypothetical protein